MERISTLIPYTQPDWTPSKRLGALDTTASPHAIAAKLGRYLLSDATTETLPHIDTLIAETVYGLTLEPYEDTGSALEARILEDARDARVYRASDGRMVLSGERLPRKYLGDHAWRWTRSSHRGVETAHVTAFRPTTAVGALDILGANNTDVIRPILHERPRMLTVGRLTAFVTLAEARWEGEIKREANREYAKRHAAGVFTDKKHCDAKHRHAAETSMFGRTFRHVEIDDDVDLDMFARIDHEFRIRRANGELPAIDAGNAFRFRKTGRHKAIGVYSPALHAIAVDPRAPRSLIHEFAHAYDFEHGQLSCTTLFKPVLDAFTARFDRTDLSESRIRYALTPTEVFARGWEVHALHTGRGGSFVGVEADFRDDPMYAPLLDMDGLDDLYATLERK